MTEEKTIVEFSEDISEATAPDPLPSGEYDASIASAEIRYSANKLKDYLSLTFLIPTENYPADYPVTNAPDGMRVSYFAGFVDDERDSRYRLKRLFQKLGLEVPGRTFDATTLIGVEARIKIDSEEYNDEVRNKVATIVAKEV